ncbi:hypothetical protein B296_00030854 [Ensete ventricosum]|uniref:Uncharacterized protein n=1 Tax=Ensete ventricosum TaxID=4639 RepID=A0A427A289_ENSVE|nr:hypothetical protein B296_00030854 [Ensete ventricosum]
MIRLRYWRITRKVCSFIRRIRKNQQRSTQLTDPTLESVIGELKQHGILKFDYSTTAAESSWEPRGMLQLEQKIEDSAKGEETQQRHYRLQRSEAITRTKRRRREGGKEGGREDAGSEHIFIGGMMDVQILIYPPKAIR